MPKKVIRLCDYRPALIIVRPTKACPARPNPELVDLPAIGDCLGFDIEMLEGHIATLDPHRCRKELLRSRKALFQLQLARQILYGRDHRQEE